MEVCLISLKIRPSSELFKNPLVIPNMKFPKGSRAREDNRLYVYNFTSRKNFHKAIDYLIDNKIMVSEIKWSVK